MTGNTPEGKRLAHQLGSSFAALARTGNPNNPAIPHWSGYDATERPVMVFDAQTRQVNDPAAALRHIWEDLMPA